LTKLYLSKCFFSLFMELLNIVKSCLPNNLIKKTKIIQIKNIYAIAYYSWWYIIHLLTCSLLGENKWSVVKYSFLYYTKMKLKLLILSVFVIIIPKAASGMSFNITPLLSRLTCGSGSTCNGIANAYSADRGVGCSTSCGWGF